MSPRAGTSSMCLATTATQRSVRLFTPPFSPSSKSLFVCFLFFLTVYFFFFASLSAVAVFLPQGVHSNPSPSGPGFEYGVTVNRQLHSSQKEICPGTGFDFRYGLKSSSMPSSSEPAFFRFLLFFFLVVDGPGAGVSVTAGSLSVAVATVLRVVVVRRVALVARVAVVVTVVDAVAPPVSAAAAAASSASLIRAAFRSRIPCADIPRDRRNSDKAELLSLLLAMALPTHEYGY